MKCGVVCVGDGGCGFLGRCTGSCLLLSCTKLTPWVFFHVTDLFCFDRVCIHIAYLFCSNAFDLSVVHCVFVLYAAGVNLS